MYWADHPQPHFHAEYAGEVASIAIGDGAELAGNLPKRALRLVRQWEAMHRNELLINWRRAGEHRPVAKIDPLP